MNISRTTKKTNSPLTSLEIEQAKRKKRHSLYLILILIILVIYHKLPEYDFVDYDDPVYVTDNQVVRQGLTIKGIKLAFTTNHAANWHPLTWLSHMLDCQLFGVNPGMHHLMSLLIHIINSFLLMLIFFKMTNATWKSFLVALLFAIHPMHVESVAWISERKDVLSALFWMLTLLSYVRYAEQPIFLRYLPVFLFCILGLLSKPMVVTLPFVLILLDFWPLRRCQFFQFSLRQEKKHFPYQSITTLIIEKIPLFFLVVIASWITVYAQTIAIGALQTYPIDLRLGNIITSYTNYIFKMIIPVNLAVFYPYPDSISPWKIVYSGFFLILITFLVVKLAKKNSYLVVGWFWFLGTMVPVIGLVQVGLQSMADRYSYLPFIGLFIMIVWGLETIIVQNNFLQKIVYLFSGIILICFMFTTYFQTLHWKNSHTLFKHATEVVENNWLACNNFGSTLDDSKFDEKMYYYNKAIQFNPDYSAPYHNRGLLLLNHGKIEEAIVNFNKALELSPKDANIHNSLAIAMARKNDINNAVLHFKKAIGYKPGYAEAYKNYGTLLARMGNFGEAINHFQKALSFDPDNTSIQKHLKNAMEDIEK